MEWGQPTNGSAARRHSSQSHGFAVRVWSNLCICSPGVVELVRSNLAPDFPLFHGLGSSHHHVWSYNYNFPQLGWCTVQCGLQSLLIWYNPTLAPASHCVHCKYGPRAGVNNRGSPICPLFITSTFPLIWFKMQDFSFSRVISVTL